MQVIKVGGPGEEMPKITNEDANIASIIVLRAALIAQIRVLESKLGEFSAQAQAAVVQKNRTGALAALRSKRTTAAVLDRRSATLGQLETVYQKIEEAADQVEVVRVMQASTEVLKSLNTEIGGAESVDAIVNDLQAEMVTVNEVGSIIADTNQAAQQVDELEVEDELEAMEQQERQEHEKISASSVKKQLEALNVVLESGSGRMANTAVVEFSTSILGTAGNAGNDARLEMAG